MCGRGSSRQVRTFCAVILAGAGVSCTGSNAPKLYPVRGEVFYQGKPAGGAQVVFHPVGTPADAPRPSGQVGEDGSYILRTYPYGDGAPQGEYHVAVVWPDAARQKGGNIPNRLPDKYAIPTTSGLQATVNAGPTDVPAFQLK